jgi:hypothetical protein
VRTRDEILEAKLAPALGRDEREGPVASRELIAPVAAEILGGRARCEDLGDRVVGPGLRVEVERSELRDATTVGEWNVVEHRDRKAVRVVLAHRERGLGTVAVQVQEARIGEGSDECAQVVDRGARALDPQRAPRSFGEPLEERAVVRERRSRGTRAQEGHRVVVELVGPAGDAGQRIREDPRQRVALAVARGGAEGVAHLGHLVAAAHHGGEEGLLGTDERGELHAADRLGREATGHVDAVEVLEDREHAGALGQHPRQQRRAAATGAYDEAIHRFPPW